MLNFGYLLIFPKNVTTEPRLIGLRGTFSWAMLLPFINLHPLVGDYWLHDVAEQGAGPGEVPKEVEGLPDESVAEELFLVVDETIVVGDGRVVVFVAGVDGSYLSHQVSYPSRTDQLGLFPADFGVENAGHEEVLVGRQVVGVLVDACVVGAKGKDFAVVAWTFVDDVGHLEDATGESAVEERDEVPVGGDCCEAEEGCCKIGS